MRCSGFVAVLLALLFSAAPARAGYQFVEDFSVSFGGAMVDPLNLGFDSAGNLLVVHQSGVNEYSSAGSLIGSFATPRQLGSGVTTYFALDASNNLFISDAGFGSVVDKFSSTGTLIGQIGARSPLFVGLSQPGGVVVDHLGNTWVADKTQNHIFEFDSSGNNLTQFGAFGFGNGGLDHPSAIAIDASGNFWIGDSSGRVQEVTSAGTYVTQLQFPQPANPLYLAFDPVGHLWVSDNASRIEEFSTDGTFMSQIDQTNLPPHIGLHAEGLAFDSAGNLWVVNGGSVDEFALVPEPSTLLLGAFGFVGISAWGWRRRDSARLRVRR